MYSESFLILALAFLGASAVPLSSTNAVGGTVGPTISETVITPYHRTDAVSSPCGQSVVRTTAVPVVPYGISTGAGFLGAGGVFPGVVGSGFTGTGVGVYPGVFANGLIENAGIGYQGIIGTGVYPDVGSVAGIGGAGFLGCAGVYPQTNFVV